MHPTNETKAHFSNNFKMHHPVYADKIELFRVKAGVQIELEIRANQCKQIKRRKLKTKKNKKRLENLIKY